MNTQAINIIRQQVICSSGLFTFEAWKNDILSNFHGRYNILCCRAWLLWLCVNYLIFSYFLQIICFNSLQMRWKDLLIFFCVLWILHPQFYINDDIGVVYIYTNSIIIIFLIINKIVWFFIWFFIKTIVIITTYVTSITNI